MYGEAYKIEGRVFKIFDNDVSLRSITSEEDLWALGDAYREARLWNEHYRVNNPELATARFYTSENKQILVTPFIESIPIGNTSLREELINQLGSNLDPGRVLLDGDVCGNIRTNRQGGCFIVDFGMYVQVPQQGRRLSIVSEGILRSSDVQETERFSSRLSRRNTNWRLDLN